LQISADVRPLKQTIDWNSMIAEFRGQSITNMMRYNADVDAWKPQDQKGHPD